VLSLVGVGDKEGITQHCDQQLMKANKLLKVEEKLVLPSLNLESAPSLITICQYEPEEKDARQMPSNRMYRLLKMATT
jgi:hypothetical protein